MGTTRQNCERHFVCIKDMLHGARNQCSMCLMLNVSLLYHTSLKKEGYPILKGL